MDAVFQLLFFIVLFHGALELDATELCAMPRRNRTFCGDATDIALGDDRVKTSKPNQCRVGCQSFSHPDIAMTTRSAECAFDLCHLVQPFRTFDHGTRMCQPRAVCISACGEEPPGCVYSGTCREFTCFHDRNTGRPANFTRITYAGPRTIVRVNDSVTSDKSPYDNSLDAVLISRDSCHGTYYRIDSKVCRKSGDALLSVDEEQEFVQCRNVCRNIRNDDVEIVRMRTSCNLCSSEAEKSVCIPQSECHARCEKPFTNVAGCVFTGTCKSMICVSGIDSKLPAVIAVTNDTGLGGVIVSVDNTKAPTTLDPPVYAKYLEDVFVPDARIENTANNDEEVGSADHSQEPMVLTEPDNVKTLKNSTGPPRKRGRRPRLKTGDGEGSKWGWLGPVVGLVGTAFTALAALAAAYIARGKAAHWGTKDSPFGGDDLYDVDKDKL